MPTRAAVFKEGCSLCKYFRDEYDWYNCGMDPLINYPKCQTCMEEILLLLGPIHYSYNEPYHTGACNALIFNGISYRQLRKKIFFVKSTFELFRCGLLERIDNALKFDIIK